jgi:hypothetical protein
VLRRKKDYDGPPIVLGVNGQVREMTVVPMCQFCDRTDFHDHELRHMRQEES